MICDGWMWYTVKLELKYSWKWLDRKRYRHKVRDFMQMVICARIKYIR